MNIKQILLNDLVIRSESFPDLNGFLIRDSVTINNFKVDSINIWQPANAPRIYLLKLQSHLLVFGSLYTNIQMSYEDNCSITYIKQRDIIPNISELSYLFDTETIENIKKTISQYKQEMNETF